MTSQSARGEGRPRSRGRLPLPHRGRARRPLPRERHAGPRRDAAGRRGTRARGRPAAQPRHLRHHLDGARGAADHRREPLPQLHRPRRVPDLGRDRAALHPHARRPLPRPRRDHRRPHPGLLGGDHARRALAEVEVEASAAKPSRKPVEKPNLVFGGDVHVVWEKFCRYFDVEPRIVPLQEGKYTIGPEDVEPHLDENTIGVAAVLGTTFTGHADDIVGINKLLRRHQGRAGPRRPAPRRRRQRRLRLALPLPRLRVGLPARAGALDQRLRAQVRARLPGHRLAGLPREERPRRGPRLLRELPRARPTRPSP